MLFTSLIFICAFFPLFFLLYYILPNRRMKNIWLFVCSLFFYAWGEPLYMPLLPLSALIGWAFALLIDCFRKKGRRRAAKCSMTLGIAALLGMLVVFKYTGFFVENINRLIGSEIPAPAIELPIGISFFTFQILSYVVDVYRGDVKAQRNFGIVAVYLCAFPQLIAGPVVRYSTVEKELTERTVALDDVYAGVRRFVVGLGKKVLIANTAAVAADGIFSYDAASCGIIAAWCGALAYTIQIFFDFSGYSDMAIGMGRMMGFKYRENFNAPYTAVSVTDFWRRWHISMSSFFRDYVYIPMGGNRVSKLRWIFNIIVVWTLTGLWHGAAWNFVVWGLYYGLLLVLEKLLWGKTILKIPVVRHLYTMLAVVVGWVIFRADTLKEAGRMLYAMVGGYGIGNGNVTYTMILERSSVGGVFLLAMIAGIILSAGLPERLGRAFSAYAASSNTHALRIAYETVGAVLSVGIFVLSVASIASGSYNPFIYFRF